MSDRSFDSAVVGSVEDAVIATAVRHLAMKSQPAPLQSAPPRLEAFLSRPPGLRNNHILPSQVEFAEQLEKEIAERAPIHGPVVRPTDRNRRLRVLIYEDDPGEVNRTDTQTPASILGSDIIYKSPTQSHAALRDPNANVPSMERTSRFGVVAAEISEQDSYIANQDVLSEYHFDRRSFSNFSQRTSGTGSAKSPKRSIRHFSFTSHRNRSVDELSIVLEQGVGTAASTPSKSSVRRSRRTTFGRPISSSSRKTSATHPAHDPAPPMPIFPSASLFSHSFPRRSLEPVSPVSPLRIRKSLASQPRPPIPAFPEAASHIPLPQTPNILERNIHNTGPPGMKRARPLPTAPIPNNVGGSPEDESLGSPKPQL